MYLKFILFFSIIALLEYQYSHLKSFSTIYIITDIICFILRLLCGNSLQILHRYVMVIFLLPDVFKCLPIWLLGKGALLKNKFTRYTLLFIDSIVYLQIQNLCFVSVGIQFLLDQLPGLLLKG